MAAKPPKLTLAVLLRTNLPLILILVFVALLGLANVLMVNQRIVLYLFYIPVVLAAWRLSGREAISVAILAAVMVQAYTLFIPGKIDAPMPKGFFWAELASWGGILVVTAWVISTLRTTNRRATANLEQAYRGVLEILSKFIQAVDTDTASHSVRVSAWSVRIAQEMGLDQSTVEKARVAGLLHDVGKTEVSLALLRKSASLSAEEKAAIGKHAAQGATLIESVGHMLAHVANAVEDHHEKFDGSGTKGLKGEAIPLVARIIAAADAFDAMTSDRPYRKGMSFFEARDTVMAESGTHFDPEVAAALKRIVDRDGEAAISEIAATADV